MMMDHRKKTVGVKDIITLCVGGNIALNLLDDIFIEEGKDVQEVVDGLDLALHNVHTTNVGQVILYDISREDVHHHLAIVDLILPCHWLAHYALKDHHQQGAEQACTVASFKDSFS